MAGFVQFDPDKWEPESPGEGPGGCAKAAKVAKVGSDLAGLAALARLPHDLAHGLNRLSRIAAPRLQRLELWPSVAADAQRLASDGWAYQALSLGWTPLDLFGAVPDKHGDPSADGLAVKLAGRPVLALCASFATVSDGPGARSYIHRGSNDGAVLLWDLGRGR